MSYHKDLDEYTEHELRQELARREAAVTEGRCDYCGRPGLVEPACKFPERHSRAAQQQQRLNRIAAGIPQVGVTEVRFHDQRHRPLRNSQEGINTIPTLDETDRGRFV